MDLNKRVFMYTLYTNQMSKVIWTIVVVVVVVALGNTNITTHYKWYFHIYSLAHIGLIIK